MNQQKLREWILKQDYFFLNPKFDGMNAWELAGIIIKEGQEIEKEKVCEFCGGTGEVSEDAIDSVGNIEKGVNTRKCVCQIEL